MFDFFNVWESAANVIFYNESTGDMSITGTARDFFTSDTLIHGAVFTAYLRNTGSNQVRVLFARDSVRYYTHVGLQLNNILMLKSNDLRTFTSVNRNIKYELIYFNQFGDTIFSFQTNPNQDKFDGLQMIRLDNKLFIYGRDISNSSSTTAPFAILCIDTTGKQLWYKTYPGKRYQTSGVVIDDEGNFLLGGGGYKGDGGAFDTLFGWYAKMDTAGNFIWEHKYEDSVIYGGGLPIVINESYYWLGDKSNLSEIAYSYIIKTDRDGNQLWAKELMRAASQNSFYPVVNGLYSPLVKNGNIYATGYEVESFDSGYTFKDFVLLAKIDTLGNLKWKRRFSQWYKDNRAFSLTAVPDGFIICADGKDTTHTTGFTDAWIIKTDTNGCIIPGCHLTDGLVQLTNPDAFVTVYPNPVTDKITVQITDNRAQLKSYLLYDSKGNFINQQAISNYPETVDIATNKLLTGTYFLVLELQGGERAVKKIMIQR
jgi:hypothetical protein